MKTRRLLQCRLQCVVGFCLSFLALAAGPSSSCVPPHAPTRHIHIVVYDAGKTFGMLPVASVLRKRGIEVIWIPLTPWSQNILEREGQLYVMPPEGLARMAHLVDRHNDGEIDYWGHQILAADPQLIVFGLVSRIQEQLAVRFREFGVPTRGFYDAFDPTSVNSIVWVCPAFYTPGNSAI